jgi:hypothetical protein
LSDFDSLDSHGSHFGLCTIVFLCACDFEKKPPALPGEGHESQ